MVSKAVPGRGPGPSASAADAGGAGNGATPGAGDAEHARVVLLRITARRAHVLRELADGYSGRESARRIGLTHNGLRSQVEDLKKITGCSSQRELGRWWREHRASWLSLMSVQAGLTAAPDAPEPPG